MEFNKLKKSTDKDSYRCSFNFYAEEEGFEPPVVSPTSVFKTGALNQLCHSSKAFIKRCKSKYIF